MTLAIATSFRGSEHLAAPVAWGYAENLRLLCLEMATEVEVIPALVTYSADNIRARNRVAALVLREMPRVTHVLWWDDDQWPEDRRIVREMMTSGEDVISAPYTNKRRPLRWVHQPLDPSPPPEGMRQEVRAVGFGFTMTTRRCLETMSRAARKYTDHPRRDAIADIFGMLYDAPGPGLPEEADMLLSEDFSFCKRWRETGGRVVLKLDSGAIYHAGGHAWSAHEMPGALR